MAGFATMQSQFYWCAGRGALTQHAGRPYLQSLPTPPNTPPPSHPPAPHRMDYLGMRQCLALLKMLMPIFTRGRDYIWLVTALGGVLLALGAPLVWTPVCVAVALLSLSATQLRRVVTPCAAFSWSADAFRGHLLREWRGHARWCNCVEGIDVIS